MWVFQNIFVRFVNLFPFVWRVVKPLSQFTKSIAQLYRILLRSRLCCLSSNGNCHCLFSRSGNLLSNRLGFFFYCDWLSPSFHGSRFLFDYLWGGCRLGAWPWRFCYGSGFVRTLKASGAVPTLHR